MTLNSGHKNMEGVKKCTKINLKTRHKSLKACTSNNKSKVVDDQLFHLNQQHRGSKVIVSPNVDKVPLKEKDQNSWLEFKKLDEGRPHLEYVCEDLSQEGRWPIQADHPFVSVISHFATDAFNELVYTHAKINKRNSLCHAEVMSCTYTNMWNAHYFYITMEAIEESILGVYKVIVASELHDGSTTLVSVTLINHRPTGKIAMMLPHLISLRSEYKTIKGMEQKLKTNLVKTRISIKGKKNRDKVAAELPGLQKEHKAIKEECRRLYKHIQSQIPKTWIHESHQASWHHVNRLTTGLISRSGTFRGYDYCTRTPECGGFAMYM